MLLSETIVILIPCNSANVTRYCYTFQIKFNFMVKKVFHRYLKPMKYQTRYIRYLHQIFQTIKID